LYYASPLSPIDATIMPPASAHPAQAPAADPMRGWWFAGLGFCVLMIGLHVVAGANTSGLSDYWRDMYWATAIAHGERFPLHGPQIYQLFELGPWWFYVLALPLALTGSVTLATAFAQVLAAAKYLLAWRLGLRLGDARLGFAFAASLAIAGWSMLPLMFPSHTGLVETTLLLLAFATWRCWRRFSPADAVLFGLAGAACLHAHPTTLSCIALCGCAVLWRHRSPAAAGWMALAAAIVVASLLPPWLDRDGAVAGALKTVPDYVGADIGVHPMRRIPEVARSVVLGGAWWGLLLMTRWNATAALLAWWLFCACLVSAACGLLRVRRRDPLLFRVALGAGAVFAMQVAFIVLLRPVTPMWMVPSCLPPLALAIAIGWYGWLGDARPWLRAAAAVAMAIYVGLSLAPFSIELRDVRAVRVMPGVNPFFDVIERSDRYINVAVPFYPVRRIERLAKTLCGPAVLHARLAAVMEATFASPVRNACGRWPELRYGGVAGDGRHVAGLLPAMARAAGIVPGRVVAGMALYDDVRAIAPASGGISTPLRRLQIDPDSGPGPLAPSTYDFEAAGGDVVVLTNRMPNAGSLQVRRIDAAGQPARLLGDDGGSRAYSCEECGKDEAVRWRVELTAIERNLDLVVLPHAPAGAVRGGAD